MWNLSGHPSFSVSLFAFRKHGESDVCAAGLTGDASKALVLTKAYKALSAHMGNHGHERFLFVSLPSNRRYSWVTVVTSCYIMLHVLCFLPCARLCSWTCIGWRRSSCRWCVRLCLAAWPNWPNQIFMCFHVISCAFMLFHVLSRCTTTFDSGCERKIVESTRSV
jgi:hypothetical protein